MTLSLSTTYAPDTVYAPLYPFGEHPEHNFQNAAVGDDPLTLNPVFSDPVLTVAGPTVDVVSYSSPKGDDTRKRLRECFGTPYADPSQLRLIPSLTSRSKEQLDGHIVRHLRQLTHDKSLVVSQPFFDDSLRPRYQIRPGLSHWLNDKANLPILVPEEYLPERFATYRNGEECWQDKRTFPPCVVKITSSSSGDGTRIVRTAEELAEARLAFRSWDGAIIVDEYIDCGRNIGVQFAIPFDKNEPPRIIGCARQIVDDDGKFFGNRIETDISASPQIERGFVDAILPRARALGWHGIGGMDVIDTGKTFYCIDPNFRYTAATPHLYHRLNGVVESQALTFIGLTPESLSALEVHGRMGDVRQKLYVLSAHEGDGETMVIGAVLFEDEEHLAENMESLRRLGVTSDSFNTPSTQANGQHSTYPRLAKRV